MIEYLKKNGSAQIKKKACLIEENLVKAKAKKRSNFHLNVEAKPKVKARRLFGLINTGQQSLKDKYQVPSTTAKQKNYEADVKSLTNEVVGN